MSTLPGPRLPGVPDVSDAIVARLLDEAERAFAAGRRELARRRHESVLYLLRDPADGPVASYVLRRVARTYLDDGDVEAAMDCLAAARVVAEAHGDTTSIASITNILAISFWQRGELDEAERLYLQAAELARAVHDTKLVAMIEQNLGIIANMHGDLPRALRHYEASLAGYRALGLDGYVGKVLGNLGIAYADLEEWDRAEETLQEALSLCRSGGDVSSALMIQTNRAEVWIAKRDFVRAQGICDGVLHEAAQVRDARATAEAQKHAGVLARETGRLEEAEELLRFAFASASARQDLLLAAETAREQAELFTRLRRNRETLQALNTSHRLFTQLKAQRDLADVQRRTRRLERRFSDIAVEWARSIEAKDAYTLGHCERVASYACAIASDLGLDPQAMFWFHIGAVLHDVGKIAVPLEILNKPGALSAEERTLIEYHPQAGEEMLRGVDFPGDVLPMVRSHHERWDGQGYPDRLAGGAIPLSARVLAVADVYDALTTDRPYRRGFTRDEALAMMTRKMAGAFDPEILARFVRLANHLPSLEQAPEVSRSGARSGDVGAVVEADVEADVARLVAA